MTGYNPEDWRRYLSKAPSGDSAIPAEDAAKEKPTANEKGRERENSKSQRITDAITTVNRTLADQREANRREERREDIGNKWLQGLTLLFVVLTTIGIFWQDYISNGQSTETKKAFGPIQDQADAAKKSADAATNQSENSDKSLIEAQRAWVGPSNVMSAADPVAGQPYDVTIEYQNTGREPATENIFDLLSFATDLNSEATEKINDFTKDCINRWRPGGGSVVYPTTGSGAYNLTKTVDASIIDDDVVQGKKTVVIGGCFVYKTFDAYHRSSFCSYFTKGKTKPAHWNICQNGNYAN